MAIRAALIAGLVLAAAPVCALESLPDALACVVDSDANWMIAGLSSNHYPDDGTHTIHLSTGTGEWYLSNARAAALVSASGRFEIIDDGTGYPGLWVGLDGAIQMRIAANQPETRFFYIDRYNTIYSGLCAEPDEPFPFLR